MRGQRSGWAAAPTPPLAAASSAPPQHTGRCSQHWFAAAAASCHGRGCEHLSRDMVRMQGGAAQEGAGVEEFPRLWVSRPAHVAEGNLYKQHEVSGEKKEDDHRETV